MTYTIVLSCSSDDGTKMSRTITGVGKSELSPKVTSIILGLDALYYQHVDIHITSDGK